MNVQRYRENKYFLTCETCQDIAILYDNMTDNLRAFTRRMDTHMLAVSQGYRTSSMTDRYDVYKIALLTFVRTETFSGTVIPIA